MAVEGPIAEHPLVVNEARPELTWAEASRRLAEARFYWLSTVCPDGRSHGAPVLAVWLNDSLYFSASPAS